MDVKIINKKNASSELNHILLHRSGYRTDDQSEFADTIGAYPSSIDILNQEILDLENNDIIDTENNDIIDTLYDLYNYDALVDDKEPSTATIKNIDGFIKKQLNTDAYHLIWLCDTARNASRYSNTDGDTESVYCVNLKHHNIMPVSDLGPEGVLIAYK